MNGFGEILKFLSKWSILLPIFQALGRFLVGLVRYIRNSKEIDKIRDELTKRSKD